MKRYLSLLLALLLAVSAMLACTSCTDAQVPSDNSDHDGHNHNGTDTDQPITGVAYDGGYFTSLIPNGMDEVSVDENLVVYVDFSKGRTLMVQKRTETLPVDENGVPSTAALDELFSKEAMRKTFSQQLAEDTYLEQTYTVLSEHRLYRLDVSNKASYGTTQTGYGSVYAVISAPDAENRVSVTVFILNGDDATHKIANAITPVLK